LRRGSFIVRLVERHGPAGHEKPASVALGGLARTVCSRFWSTASVGDQASRRGTRLQEQYRGKLLASGSVRRASLARTLSQIEPQFAKLFEAARDLVAGLEPHPLVLGSDHSAQRTTAHFPTRSNSGALHSRKYKGECAVCAVCAVVSHARTHGRRPFHSTLPLPSSSKRRAHPSRVRTAARRR
jgi:hypothetical protein